MEREGPGRVVNCHPRHFEQFYRLHYEVVFGFHHRRVQCPDTAADLCAETFFQAWRSAGRYDEQLGTGRTWLLGIAANVRSQWLRSAQRRRRVAALEHGLVGADDDLDLVLDRIVARSAAPALSYVVAGMTPPTRAALVARVVSDLPYSDVAEVLGCSRGAARVRVARALAVLRRSDFDIASAYPPNSTHSESSAGTRDSASASASATTLGPSPW